MPTARSLSIFVKNPRLASRDDSFHGRPEQGRGQRPDLLCYSRGIKPVLAKRAGLAAALLILSVTAIVRLGGLGRGSYWTDEVFESFTIHGSWSFLWARLREDAVHPPLDSVIVKCFEVFRPSDAARRIPAAVWGIGAVAAAGWLLRRRAGAATALLGMGLLALSPVHVRYSQELRPYSLGIFLILLSLCALELLMERPSPRRALLFFLPAVATLYTLTLAAVGLAVAGGALALEDAFSAEPGRRASARRFWKLSPLLAAVLAVAYLPWVSVFARGVAWLGRAYPRRMTASAAVHLLSELTLSYKFGGFSFGPPRLYQAVFAVYIGLVVFGAVVSFRRPGLRFLPLWAGGGFLAIEILRLRSPVHFGSRYFLPAGIALPLLAAAGLARILSIRNLRAPAVASLAAILVIEAAAVGLYYEEGRADWRPLTRFLSRSRRPIFTDDLSAQLCLAYYLCGPEWLARGRECSIPIVNLQGQTGPLEAQAGTGEPSWLVLSTMPSADALKEETSGDPSIAFPEAEGATLKKFPANQRWVRNESTVVAIPSRSGT